MKTIEQIKAHCRDAIALAEKAATEPDKWDKLYRGPDSDFAWAKHARTFSPASAAVVLCLIESIEHKEKYGRDLDTRESATDLLTQMRCAWERQS